MKVVTLTDAQISVLMELLREEIMVERHILNEGESDDEDESKEIIAEMEDIQRLLNKN